MPNILKLAYFIKVCKVKLFGCLLLDTKSCQEYSTASISTIYLVGFTNGFIWKNQKVIIIIIFKKWGKFVSKTKMREKRKFRKRKRKSTSLPYSAIDITNLEKIGKWKFSTQNNKPKQHIPAQEVNMTKHIRSWRIKKIESAKRRICRTFSPSKKAKWQDDLHFLIHRR